MEQIRDEMVRHSFTICLQVSFHNPSIDRSFSYIISQCIMHSSLHTHYLQSTHNKVKLQKD